MPNPICVHCEQIVSFSDETHYCDNMKEAGILEPVPIDKNDTENFDLDLECDDLLADESLPFNDDVYAEDDVTDLVDFQPDFHPFDD